MKRFFLVVCTGLITATAFQACKKSTPLLSPSDWVVGSWRLTLQGPDKNNDGQFNAEEKNTIHDSAIVTYQFKSGGAGYRIGPNMAYVDTLRWTLINNSTTLNLRINDHGLTSDEYYRFDLNYGNETILITDTSVRPVYFKQYQREN